MTEVFVDLHKCSECGGILRYINFGVDLKSEVKVNLYQCIDCKRLSYTK